MVEQNNFTFQISLSVLNHLGRNLYRSFVTVLGEAISNSWDANAKHVFITIDREKNILVIKDDGDGMTSSDFQDKFLKIGYSKRKDGENKSSLNRPYIGRKGIGKLALLSCADKISIISKVSGGEYVGGVIDNSGLDEAILEDLSPNDYPLESINDEVFEKYMENHEKGTIIYFDNINEGIKNRIPYLRKIIALHFRFSLTLSDKSEGPEHDQDSFDIILNDEIITLNDLDDFAKQTEFLWNINELQDPYITDHLTNLKEVEKKIKMKGNIKGFIASVEKPSYLKILNTKERIGIDLFVHGRLRERNILKHIPTTRYVESYLYGQIHYNELDEDKHDRFTTSREGMKADDPKYKIFLENFIEVISTVLKDWDKWRLDHKMEGDSENTRITKKERSSLGLFHIVSTEFDMGVDSENKIKVNEWIDGLANDASHNISSYTECFISENLVRKYIVDQQIALINNIPAEVASLRNLEDNAKIAGNINIDIRQNNSDLSYLDMMELSKIVDIPGNQNNILLDAKQYRPIRNALMHTALLTSEAKIKLSSVYDNIKARVRALLDN